MPETACAAWRPLRPGFRRWLLILLCLSSSTAWSAFTTRLPVKAIDNALQQHFPLREYATFARLSFGVPEVILVPGSADLELRFPVMAKAPGNAAYQGHVGIAVNVSYKPGTGGLYLYGPRLQTVGLPELPADMLDAFRATVSTVMQNALPLVQIYQVRERDLNHTLAMSELKSMEIEADGLLLVFGFD